MGIAEIGRQLRALRTASGRTVASVAADAGLSVPYIANLENGRGNPTLAALGQLASALGMRLVIALAPVPASAAPDNAAQGSPGDGRPGGVPGSLVRLGRTERFRAAVAQIASRSGADEREVSADVVSALAAAAAVLRREPAEADWWRLLDALLLAAACPAG